MWFKVCEKTIKIFNLKNFPGKMETATGEQKLRCEKVGLRYLIRYFYLICFAGYLIEPTLKNKNSPEGENVFSEEKKTTFYDWMKNRKEIKTLLEGIRLY